MVLEVKNIKKTFLKSGTKIEVLDGVSLSVCKGQFAVIQGPSGCGKTTLLHVIGTLLSPDQGEVVLSGQNPYLMNQEDRAEFRSQTIGFVFQQFHLLPYLNVLENVLLPALAVSTPNSKEQAVELIKKFGMENRINHLPMELSVGEKQRTALARAMLYKPDLLLADEPTGNLDDDNSETILKAFSDYAASGKTVIMVTHDCDAVKYAKKVFKISNRKITEK